MLGSRLILPGPNVDAESVLDLMVQERVTLLAAACLQCGLAYFARSKRIRSAGNLTPRFASRAGGTAPPESLIRALDKHGLHILHLWGMTETTPLATVGA